MKQNCERNTTRWFRVGLRIVAAFVVLAWSARAQPLPPAVRRERLSNRVISLRLDLKLEGQSIPGQIVVKCRQDNYSPLVQDYTVKRLLAATAKWGTRVLEQIPEISVMLLQVPPGAEEEIVGQLQADPFVQYVDLNRRVHILEVPNDSRWPEQWALLKIGAPQAWDIARCQGVVIAILDTGIALDHPDLRNVLWTNPGEIPDNGIDDDGNSKVDDIHGWHFFQQWNGSYYEPYENRIIKDDNGHGTHVTGIAAAETNNLSGIAGVSWGAHAMIVKVMDERGDGWNFDIARGIVYATDNGAQIINLSLGGAEPSQILQDAVNYAYGKGVLLVAAAGNNGGAVFYPAACEHVLAVAATDIDDQRCLFSNYGPEVDIAAPGEYIISTWPQPYLYYYKYGTSMAAAHVSGAAALLWSWQPGWSNAQIEQRLEMQADDVNASTHPGRDPYLGWGRLNIGRALQDPTPTPTPTLSPTLTPPSRSYHLPLIFKGINLCCAF